MQLDGGTHSHNGQPLRVTTAAENPALHVGHCMVLAAHGVHTSPMQAAPVLQSS
jgi:hypothetical protein